MRNHREWNKQIRDGRDCGNPRTTTSMTLEIFTENLVAKGRAKQTSTPTTSSTTTLPHRLSGLTWNQVRTTRVVSKCRKR